jgi:hypothetical protein
MPESINETITSEINERDMIKNIGVTITVNVKITKDLRVRVGVFLVKIGYRLMGMKVEEKQINDIDDAIHNIGF